ncbi:phospholipid/cholesterol/gamma-HCH transport system substrate-binding protein [Allochromatium warmingii]|uniref:Phospholipid/cholesterol/gamma-HCH transport system substrate-binding protein n=1 Tax=Allochromatium warmingii TaxID=61595 RepID=A0A1H3FUA6_ALLWA|nr:hypothetical protein [Allochromatium warmingii]SDX93719.1 phospholipid/cholesterol/gamma-HCH transport system substrate-binding protein [Allochromatium warmingii]
MSRLERFYTPPEIGAPGRRRGRVMRRDLLLSALFVLGMLALVLGVLSLILPGFGQRTYWLEANFLHAKGLEVGTPVMQQGYVIGLVEQIEPIFSPNLNLNTPPAPRPAHCQPRADGELPPTIFRARLRLLGDWPIPADSHAQIGATGPLQPDAVKILPGRSATRLESGACLMTLDREADVIDHLLTLTDQLSHVTLLITRLVDETLAPALQRIANQIATLERLLGTGTDSSGAAPDADVDAAAAGLAGTFRSLRDYLAELEAAINPDEIRRIVTAIASGSTQLAALSTMLNQRAATVEQIVQHLAAITANLEHTLRENRPPLQQSLADSQYVLQELAASIGPILSNLEETTRQLSDLARELRQEPRTLFRRHEHEARPPWFDQD